METHYQKLSSFAVLVKSLYPKAITIHPLYESIDKATIHPEDLQILFEMLVHTITLINRLYRLQDKEGSYISQREDYATALMMISPLFTTKTLQLPESIRRYYQQLLVEIGFSRDFTWKDVQNVTGKSKTRCNNIINNLKEIGMVKQSGKGYRDIYRYELIPMREVNNPPGAWDEAIEEWRDFKGWQAL